MSSIVVRDLYDRFEVNSDVGIACFAFDFANRERHTTENILRDIIKQLMQRRDLLPTPILTLYKTYPKSESGLIPIASLKDALDCLIKSFSSVYVVLDALDECSEKNGFQRSIMRTLSDVQASSKLNLIATSRYIPSIQAHFDRCPSIQIHASEEDLQRYIQGRHDALDDYDPLSYIPVAIVQEKIITSVDCV